MTTLAPYLANEPLYDEHPRPSPLQPAPAEPLYRTPSLARAPAPVRSRGGRASRPAQPAPYASTPSPYAQPDLWDTLGLAGVVFLGTVRISGDAGVKLDVAKSAGSDGGTVRDKGYELAKLKLKVTIWDEVTWVSWDGLLPVIDPRRQVGRRTPVDASHPALAQRNISRLYIEKISLPDVKADGTVEFTIDAIEFHPGTRAGNVSHRAAATAPDLGANAVAFRGLEPAPPGVPAPSTTPATGPDE